VTPSALPAPQLCVDRPPRPHVVNEQLFKNVLVRERRRADRSNEPFLLFLISSSDPTFWSATIEAVNAAKRETDVLGWFSHRQVLGVIIPDISLRDATIARSIETRLHWEISRRVPAASRGAVTIELRVHPELSSTEQQFKRVDPLLTQIRPVNHSASKLALKRALDIVGSLTLLVMLSPVLAVIAGLVKFTSKGPVFFRQPRIGEGEKPFTMLKFRTMYTGADSKIHHEFVTKFIKASAEINEPAIDARFKIAHDPRITPIGHFLRKTSLDELPQFWNVLRGEMSLVGPRPPLAYEVEQYQPWHCRRVMEAKPGVTGLWQVTGRSRTTFDEMVRLDLRYAKTHSFWNDIKILLATPAAVISGKGAA
jgi:exopolysaccharide biosynthesis polyprenyl glycosylphosphotransferase